jgi:hypothetical protein
MQMIARANYNDIISSVRAQLGEPAFTAAQAAGQTLSSEAAVALVLDSRARHMSI